MGSSAGGERYRPRPSDQVQEVNDMNRFAMAALASILALSSLLFVQPEPFAAQLDEKDQMWQKEPVFAQQHDDLLWQKEPVFAEQLDDPIWQKEPVFAEEMDDQL